MPEGIKNNTDHILEDVGEPRLTRLDVKDVDCVSRANGQSVQLAQAPVQFLISGAKPNQRRKYARQ